MRNFAALVMASLIAAASAVGFPGQSAAVFNGSPISWVDHPEIAQIELLGSGSGVDCGATFLSDTWVLTAAHCVTEMDTKLGGCDSFFWSDDCYIDSKEGGLRYAATTKLPASSVRVATSSGQRLDVADVFVHDAYTVGMEVAPPSFQFLPCVNRCSKVVEIEYVAHDVAVLRLATPAIGVSTVQLFDDESALVPGLALTAYGWGDTDPGIGYAPSRELRVTPANTLKLTDPLAFPSCYPEVDQPVPVQRSVLCAVADKDTGVGHGDSGGPWFATGADGVVRQIGITSFGADPKTVEDKSEFATTQHPNGITSIPGVAKWIRSKTGVSAGSSSSADNVATALVIDNSGSMSWNDPSRVRLDAAISYLNAAVPGDYVGAVGFEGSANQISPMQQLPGGKDNLSAALGAGVYDGGGTNIGAGLSDACALLDSSALPERRAAILLTDGDGGYSNEASCFASRGWQVYTVGLGSSVNTSLLQQIANSTGGTYQPVPKVVELQCKFQQVRALVAGGHPMPCQADVIQLGQTVTKSVDVAERLSQVTFSTRWPGSDVAMALISPSGRRIARDTVAWDVTQSVAATHEEIVIKVPEPGQWTVELFGADIEPGGEEVVFASSQVPFTNQLPLVAGSAQPGAESATWDFTAQTSDPDGSIDNIVWNFGDGHAGMGMEAKHHYSQSGAYIPTVTAVDDSGETSTYELPTVVVDGPPSPTTASFTSESDGLQLDVDASASNASSGIVRYLWDFDGDGNLDHETTDPVADWKYSAPGQYEISLAVESADGSASLIRKNVSVGNGSGTSGDIGLGSLGSLMGS